MLKEEDSVSEGENDISKKDEENAPVEGQDDMPKEDKESASIEEQKVQMTMHQRKNKII